MPLSADTNPCRRVEPQYPQDCIPEPFLELPALIWKGFINFHPKSRAKLPELLPVTMQIFSFIMLIFACSSPSSDIGHTSP